MLPVTVDDTPPYELLNCIQPGFHIVLVRNEKPDQNSKSEPLWLFPCRDERSLDAAVHWFAVRRGLWQAWGEMAEQSGSAALSEHIAELMAEAPIGEAQATLVQRDPDPRVLNLGEILVTNQSVRNEILYSHRYSTPGKRKRFYEWLWLNMSNGNPELLMDVGTKQGTAALAKLLEQIASRQEVNLALSEAA